MEMLAHEKTTELHCITEGKKNKSQIIQGNMFGIIWSRRERRSVRRQNSKTSGGQGMHSKEGRHGTESLQRQDGLAR